MMTRPVSRTRAEWMAARLDLLEAEKDLTRRSDELARCRQDLPWVQIDKEYDSTPMKGAPRWLTCSEGARSSSSTHFAPSASDRATAWPGGEAYDKR